MSSCGCSTQIGNDAACYAQSSGATIIVREPDATLKMLCARVGVPSSQTWVPCLVAAFILTRRVIYFKVQPGDCGANVRPGPGTTGQVAIGIGSAAIADPEPISKGVLTGISSIFGAFTAHHQQAVMTEQATLCDVAVKYNGAAETLEQMVSSGQYDPDTAAQVLSQIVSSLISEMAPIRKTCNAACGFTYALQALLIYNRETVYPSLYNAPTQAIGANLGTPGASGVVVPAAPLNDLTNAANQLLSGGGNSKTLALLAAAGIAVVAIAR